MHQFTDDEKDMGFGWNKAGVEPYKVLRSYYRATHLDHWKKSWQDSWARSKEAAPAVLLQGQHEVLTRETVR